MKHDTSNPDCQDSNEQATCRDSNDYASKLDDLDAVSKQYDCLNDFYVKSSDCVNDFYSITKELEAELMLPFLNLKKGGKALELGCGVGESSTHLAPFFSSLVVCDGSETFLMKARDRLKAHNHVEFRYALFEEITDENLYDFIAANYILEHVDDVGILLEICYKALKQGGYLFVIVPNAKALSRQLAVKMGLLDSIYTLAENDIKHGHKRIFDIDSFMEEITKTKFDIIAHGGVYVKPLANFQLSQLIDTKILNKNHFKGLKLLADDYPELSGSIYFVLSK